MNDKHEIESQDDIELTGEDIIDDPELEEIESSNIQKLKKLQGKLKKCEEEKMEHLESLQRSKAEFLNAKRRMEEERERDKERAVTKQIEKLLPLADSFYMAMSNEKAWGAVDEQWRRGVESIHNQLNSILDSYGIVELSPIGETFDPNLHEAMTEIPVEDKSMDHKVVSVLQNGFVRKVGDTSILIRPARVTVGIFQN